MAAEGKATGVVLDQTARLARHSVCASVPIMEIRLIGVEHLVTNIEIRTSGDNPFDRKIEFRILPDDRCPPDESHLLEKADESPREPSPTPT